MNVYMRQLKITGKNLMITDSMETLFEKKVTKFGSGAKIDCPKEHLGKRVYVIVRKED